MLVVLAAPRAREHGYPTPATEQAEDAARSGVSPSSPRRGRRRDLALILWAAIRYRRRADALPDQRTSHLTLEIVYTAVPVPSWPCCSRSRSTPSTRSPRSSDDPDVVVDVVGYQWDWKFTYPDEGVTSVPGDDDPPRCWSCRWARRCASTSRSPDVIHSFWVPEFLEKRDLIPGVDNAIDVDVNRAGTWTGRCAEYCGLDHWKMDFEVQAMAPDDFDAWLAEQAPTDGEPSA